MVKAEAAMANSRDGRWIAILLVAQYGIERRRRIDHPDHLRAKGDTSREEDI